MKINYKSDFDFLLDIKDPDGQPWGLPTVPIRVVLFTQLRSQNCYVATYNPYTGEMTNCVVDDACLRIVCDNHGLQPGYLCVEAYIDIPDATYPDGVRTEVATASTEIVLVPYVCEENGMPTVNVGCSCKCPCGGIHPILPPVEEPGGDDPSQGSNPGEDGNGEGDANADENNYPDDPFRPGYNDGNNGDSNNEDPNANPDPSEGENGGGDSNPTQGDSSECDCGCHDKTENNCQGHQHHHQHHQQHHHNHHHHDGDLIDILGEIARANKALSEKMDAVSERLDKVENSSPGGSGADASDEWEILEDDEEEPEEP